jgi:hypothetical protein
MSKLVYAISVLVMLGSGIARAEDADPEMQGPPTKEPVRSGATVTLSFGPGEYHIIPDSGDESRVEGAAFSLRAGAAISQTSAFEGMLEFVNGRSKSLILGASLKFYTSQALYIRIGGGIGTIALSGGGAMPSSQRFWGPGAAFGVGYEFFQLRDIALFGELEASAYRLVTKYTDPTTMTDVDPKTTLANVQLVFGITWF